MTPDDVASRISALRTLGQTDLEAAAAGAEELRIEVLQEIANANPAWLELARGALTTVTEDIGGD
jgi:hypothetical protein